MADHKGKLFYLTEAGEKAAQGPASSEGAFIRLIFKNKPRIDRDVAKQVARASLILTNSIFDNAVRTNNQAQQTMAEEQILLITGALDNLDSRIRGLVELGELAVVAS